MNCLEFRREILVEPWRAGPEADGHAQSCAACAKFREMAADLEADIRGATAVVIPDGLVDRVLQRTTRKGAAFTRHAFAIAAALMLTVGVGTAALWLTRDDPLARAGIDFVVDEEANAILTSKPSDPGSLAAALRAMNVHLPPQIGEIRYIGICPFQGTIAHHVVVITPQGKATLLLFPEKPVEGKGTASARGLRSMVAPAPTGSLAIITASESGLERIEQMVVRS